jgi:hypothetical protein
MLPNYTAPVISVRLMPISSVSLIFKVAQVIITAGICTKKCKIAMFTVLHVAANSWSFGSPVASERAAEEAPKHFPFTSANFPRHGDDVRKRVL